MRKFEYGGQYPIANYGSLAMFLAVSSFIALVYKKGIAPKTLAEAAPLFLIAIGLLALHLFIWLRGRPLAIGDDSIAILAMGFPIKSIDWDGVTEVEMIDYFDPRKKRERQIIAVRSSIKTIWIYDMIDFFPSIKRELQDKISSKEVVRIRTDRSKGTLRVPDSQILEI